MGLRFAGVEGAVVHAVRRFMAGVVEPLRHGGVGLARFAGVHIGGKDHGHVREVGGDVVVHDLRPLHPRLFGNVIKVGVHVDVNGAGSDVAQLRPGADALAGGPGADGGLVRGVAEPEIAVIQHDILCFQVKDGGGFAALVGFLAVLPFQAHPAVVGQQLLQGGHPFAGGLLNANGIRLHLFYLPGADGQALGGGHAVHVAAPDVEGHDPGVAPGLFFRFDQREVMPREAVRDGRNGHVRVDGEVVGDQPPINAVGHSAEGVDSHVGRAHHVVQRPKAVLARVAVVPSGIGHGIRRGGVGVGQLFRHDAVGLLVLAAVQIGGEHHRYRFREALADEIDDHPRAQHPRLLRGVVQMRVHVRKKGLCLFLLQQRPGAHPAAAGVRPVGGLVRRVAEPEIAVIQQVVFFLQVEDGAGFPLPRHGFAVVPRHAHAAVSGQQGLQRRHPRGGGLLHAQHVRRHFQDLPRHNATAQRGRGAVHVLTADVEGHDPQVPLRLGFGGDDREIVPRHGVLPCYAAQRKRGDHRKQQSDPFLQKNRKHNGILPCGAF